MGEVKMKYFERAQLWLVHWMRLGSRPEELAELIKRQALAQECAVCL